MKLAINNENITENFFDVSLLLYFITYLIFYDSVGFLGSLRLLATSSILVSGLLLLYKKSFRVEIPVYAIWYSFFITWSLTSSIWAFDSSKVVVVSMIRILLLCLFLQARITSVHDINKIFLIYIVAVICRCVYIFNLMMNYYGTELILLRRFGDAFNYNSNETAFMSGISLMLVVYLIKEKYIKSIFFILIICAVLMTSLVLAGSKKAILGIFLFFAIYGQLTSTDGKKLSRTFSSLIIILVLYGLIMTLPILYNTIGVRIENMLSLIFSHTNSDDSTANRIKLIVEGLEVWYQHPILGVGLNNFSLLQDVGFGQSNYYSHCNYVELLADLGIIGFLIYYVYLFRLCLKKLETNVGIFLRALVLVLLILDLGTISFQQYYLHIFFILHSLVVYERNINKNVLFMVYNKGIQS